MDRATLGDGVRRGKEITMRKLEKEHHNTKMRAGPSLGRALKRRACLPFCWA